MKHTLEQAVLDALASGCDGDGTPPAPSPCFGQVGGKRVPPVIQRMRSDVLLAAVFPDQAACQENVTRPIAIPDHPLVAETMRNCLYEAMDLKGVEALLRKIENREVRLIARDTPTPSPLSHEILNSNPYTYLDDAPLEERRARAVATRRTLSPEDLRVFGSLDEEAITEIENENWPDVRNEDELADLLREWILLPKKSLPKAWKPWMETLLAGSRAREFNDHFISEEKKEIAQRALAGDEETATGIMGAWLRAGGPATATQWAERTGLSEAAVSCALLRLEAAGAVLRGRFRKQALEGGFEEWCDREVLARIHRRCLLSLRKQMQPATTAEFIRYLLRWQHVAPGTQLHGPHGVVEVIAQLQGLQLPTGAWEKEIFPSRVMNYDSSLLDELCLGGTVVWGRLFPGRVEEEEREGTESSGRRRATPNRNTNLSVMLRQDLPWLLAVTRASESLEGLGDSARALLELLKSRGAMFFNELQVVTGRLRSDLDSALWELVTAGAITCDGFAGLRNLIHPSRRREKARLLARYPYSKGPLFMGGGGRWSLLRPPEAQALSAAVGPLGEPAELEALAAQYLRRWGLVFRDLLGREPHCPPWRVLVGLYRRLEARGEIRGGRFVAGFSGEQFALPEAVEALRGARRADASDASARISLSATDPLNVTGFLTPPPRIPATLVNRVIYVGGVPESPEKAAESMTRQMAPALHA
jgi:ATP-dependent Lhr-like helicase